ncbi:MAG: thioredoxin-dependent thiol peroxidase [Leptolyngbyaceae cyanobacterium CSU_1_3]|nr:thioredoxin-dependent thiol peroxidase [Leptolyngbyaceae cyanobacterium CSU_1_3]
MILQIGDPAPDFTLPDLHETPIGLSTFKGQRVVLYFYPRDNTPGCTKEAIGFRESYAAYQAQNIVILGISTDTAKSHEKFATKYDLPFPLLCDEGGKIAAEYDSYGLKKFMGKEYMGISRNTFVISPDGKIEKIYKKVKPEAHAAQILADLST